MDDYSIRCKLSMLSQVGSVLDYQIEFEKLSSKAMETHEQILVSIFIFGLKPDIRWDLERNRPTALKEAFASARHQESRLEVLRLARNKVVEELADSDVTGEIEENVDMLPDYEESKAIEIVETYQIQEIEEVQNAIESSQSQPELPLPMEYHQVNQIQGLVCHGLTAPRSKNHIACVFARAGSTFVHVAAFQLSSSQRREIWHQEDLWIDSSYKMAKLIFGHFLPNVARGGIALKFYALAEVYKDLHLEDNVIFILCVFE